jgi:GNAT superfamily N-acetyltransferase
MRIVAVKKDDPRWDKTIRFSEGCSWIPGRRLAEKMRADSLRDWEQVFAAVEDEEIAGFCVFEYSGNMPPELDFHPFINLVFVGEAHRGQRLSEKMVSAALAYAKELGYRKVYLKSEHHGLYEKYGFRKIADFKPLSGIADQLFEMELGARGDGAEQRR